MSIANYMYSPLAILGRSMTFAPESGCVLRLLRSPCGAWACRALVCPKPAAMARRLRELGRHLAAAAPCASGRAVEETSSPSGRALGALDGAAVGSPEWLTRTGTAQRPTVPSDEPPSVVAACSGAPYSAAQTAQIAEQFRRDGYYFLGPTLEQREVEVLRAAAERRVADPRNQVAGDSVQGATLFRMFETDSAARDLIVREPFASLAGAPFIDWAQRLLLLLLLLLYLLRLLLLLLLPPPLTVVHCWCWWWWSTEAILGNECHMMSQNVRINGRLLSAVCPLWPPCHAVNCASCVNIVRLRAPSLRCCSFHHRHNGSGSAPHGRRG
jgi:hypothetical protein